MTSYQKDRLEAEKKEQAKAEAEAKKGESPATEETSSTKREKELRKENKKLREKIEALEKRLAEDGEESKKDSKTSTSSEPAKAEKKEKEPKKEASEPAKAEKNEVIALLKENNQIVKLQIGAGHTIRRTILAIRDENAPDGWYPIPIEEEEFYRNELPEEIVEKEAWITYYPAARRYQFISWLKGRERLDSIYERRVAEE